MSAKRLKTESFIKKQNLRLDCKVFAKTSDSESEGSKKAGDHRLLFFIIASSALLSIASALLRARLISSVYDD
ncbi:MAG: hypothetical protein A3K41_05190 [Chloroflexi bacterium RIFOXYD12_FULL_57_15]|nr:MAG: hypothetical protein A3K41_05190 [Chloroflexi bacterium RIFOXYD12_FULL_57_15]